jgi:uncharacterized membrane protein YczE
LIIKQLRTILTNFRQKKYASDKFLRIIFGLILYAFGVHLTIYANIGLAPWDCLAMGISHHIPLNYGGAVVLIGITAIILQLLMKERVGFATLTDALLTGNLVQFFNEVSPFPENHSLCFGIVLMLCGFLFLSIGMRLYMSAEQGCGPKDGLLIAVSRKLPKIPVGIVEVMLLAVVTITSWILGGSVGIGTFISVFDAGMVMHLFYSMIGFDPRELKHKSLTETLKVLSGK